MFASRPASVRAFRYGWTAFLVCATSFPYLLSFLSAPAGYRYTWILPPYPEDSLGYLSWSEQAARGALLFKVKYTALAQPAFLFHPFFLICGWAGRVFSVDLALVHFIAKEIGVVLFFLLFYKYTDYLELTDFQTVVASILLGVSSGTGGVLAFMGFADRLPFKPADLWVPELTTYWSLLWNPLFPYSLLLMLLVIYQIDRSSRLKRKRDIWVAGLTAGVLALVHPYSQPLLLTFAVILITVRVRDQWLSYLIRYCIPLFPFDLYLLLLLKFQPVVSQHNSRGAMTSPSVPALLAGFGVPLLILLLGFTVEWGGWLKRYWQVGLWFLLCFSFSYLPLWFQRKLILGAHIPLCILAAISFDLMLSRISSPPRRKLAAAIATIALIPVLVATPVYLLKTERAAVQDNSKGAYFLSDDVVNAMKYLKNRTNPEELVLASLGTSRFIPAYSGNRVLWGHWAMSVDFERRKDWYETLFGREQNWYDTERSNMFWSTGIVYIFSDQDMKRAIENRPWQWDVILRHADKVFQNGAVTIYKHHGNAAGH